MENLTLGTHYLDPEPGKGRTARAQHLADAVPVRELRAAMLRQVVALADGFLVEAENPTSPHLAAIRTALAQLLVRISIAARAIRIAKKRSATCN